MVDYLTENYSNIILTILTIIGMSKIFINNNISWWKSLIPVYNEYTFTKYVAKEDGLAKKVSISCIAFIIISFIFGIYMGFVYAEAFNSATNYIAVEELEKYLTANPNLSLGIFILSILTLLSFILYFIYWVKVRYRFTLKNNMNGWFILVWIFLSPFMYIYFGFFKKGDISE